MQFLTHILVTAALLFVVGKMVDGIDVRGARAALFGSLAIGLANALLKPTLIALSLPLTLLTLGLFIFVINAALIMLAAEFVDGFEVEGFGAAMRGAFWLWVLNMGVGILFGL